MKEESYDFCNRLDKYILNDIWVEQLSQNYTYTQKCHFTELDMPGKFKEMNKICAMFKSLYFLLFENSFLDTYNVEDNIKYMNFWLNYQLKNIYNLSISADDFYNKLNSIDVTFDEKYKLKDRIYNIHEFHYNNMNIIYIMYDNYNKIKNKIADIHNEGEKTCLVLSQECVKKFEVATQSCSAKDNTSFCNSLKNFRKKYEGIYDSSSKTCQIEQLTPISSGEFTVAADQREQNQLHEQQQAIQALHGDVQVSSKSIMEPEEGTNDDGSNTIFSTIGASFGSLLLLFATIKYTPIGTWLSHRIKGNKSILNGMEIDKPYKLLLHDSEHESINSENNEYQISYYSTENS
ncbi:PIR Superfamily Protein [Plasmodium ovale curtisi]|uniref:PIR Superfamily Protein n=1 Tax=Plasmodium ovale curtisi TaxID=864141 RepID=A0A1A8XB64_PLAOA|nr:PIR Superfamily Protein [Plasmodium ovale curtisi]